MSINVNRINAGLARGTDAEFLQRIDKNKDKKIDQTEFDQAIEDAGGENFFNKGKYFSEMALKAQQLSLNTLLTGALLLAVGCSTIPLSLDRSGLATTKKEAELQALKAHLEKGGQTTNPELEMIKAELAALKKKQGQSTSPNPAQALSVRTTTLAGKILIPSGVLLPSGANLPSGVLLPSGFTTLAEKGEQILIGKEFLVEAFDKEGKSRGRAFSEAGGSFKIPEAPVGVQLKLHATYLADSNLKLKAVVDVPEEKAGQETVKNITTASTAVAVIVEDAQKKGSELGNIPLFKFETSPELVALVSRVESKITENLGKKLDRALEEIQDIKDTLKQVLQELEELKRRQPDIVAPSATPAPLASQFPPPAATPPPSVAPSAPQSTTTPCTDAQPCVSPPSPSPGASATPTPTPIPSPTPTSSPTPTPTPPPSGDFTVTLTGNVQMVFKPIAAGTFTMGSPNSDADAAANEKPPHQVTLTQGFYLQTTEVTQGQWLAVMGSSYPGAAPSSSYGVGDNYPLYYVSWNDAQSFITTLNGLGQGTFRLPTEAEWEYAARAGTTTIYSFGDSNAQLGTYAWFSGNSSNKSHPVGTKSPNPWGLYDMSGNVYEWVQDFYGSSYSSGSVTDPSGPASGSSRVGRGGSWGYGAQNCRSAYRGDYDPSYRGLYLGFRLVRSL